MRKIGLIAGNGKFPLIFAREARRQGVALVVVAHRGETAPEIERASDDIRWVRVGELGAIIDTFRRAGITEAVMAGGIQRARLWSSFRPDLRGIAFLARMLRRDDDGLLRGVAEELERDGIRVVESTLFLEELIPAAGILTRRSPTAREREDMALGFRVVKEVGRLGIGQSVAVKDLVVLTVEAVEGTDAMIRRAGALVQGGFVVVKASKPEQDLRFDVPAVGMETVRVLGESGGAVLAVEAGKTVLLERDEMLREADAKGIAVVALAGGEFSSV
jgi:hypothetical protein